MTTELADWKAILLEFEEKDKQRRKYARLRVENEKGLKSIQEELEKELKENNKEHEVQIIHRLYNLVQNPYPKLCIR